MTGSIPISIERSITLIIVRCSLQPTGSRNTSEARQLVVVSRVGRRLPRQRGPGCGYSSPKPASRHPERGREAAYDECSARPDEVVTTIALHGYTRELALAQKCVLVSINLDALARLKPHRLRFKAAHDEFVQPVR